jgi:hypothetical protein
LKILIAISVLLIFSALLSISFMTPTNAETIFSDGFESGDFSAWTDKTVSESPCSLTASTTQSHNGSWSEKAEVSGSGWTDAYVYKNIEQHSTAYTSLYVYIESFSAEHYIRGLTSSSGAKLVAYFGLRSDRSLWLFYRNNGSFYEVTSSTKLAMNTWANIQLKTTVGDTSGECRVWKDGDEVPDLTQVGLNNSDAIGIRRIGCGIIAAYSVNATIYFDDVTVDGSYIRPSYEVTFNQSGLGPSAVGNVVKVNGSSKTVGNMPYSQWIQEDSQLNYTYEDTVASNVTGERYNLSNTTGPASPFNVTSTVTVTGNYRTQYYLAVDSLYGEPNPTSGWYYEGEVVNASVPSPSLDSNGTRYVCTGWNGTGSVPLSGTGTGVTFTITEPSSITWNWQTQYLLSVLTDPSDLSPRPEIEPIGEPVPLWGWWYDAFTNVTLTAQPVLENEFNNWDIDGIPQENETNLATVTMDAPHVATAHYTAIHLCLLTFDQTGLDDTTTGTVVTINSSAKYFTDLPFNQWVDEGSQIEYNYENTVATNVTGKRSELTNVTGSTSPFNVTGNATVTGNYKIQYYFTVSSIFGSPYPTSGWNDTGTEITASVVSPVLGSDGTRYVCVGWSGTGSVPASGTTASVTFVLLEPSNITWSWKIQYSLTVLTNPAGLLQPLRDPTGDLGGADNWWYDYSLNVTLTAQPNTDYVFDGWDVDGSSYGTGVNPIVVNMDGPHIARANSTYVPPVVHDIAVTEVTVAKTVVGQGYSCSLNVTVENQGGGSEDFNVTLFANMTLIATRTVTNLQIGEFSFFEYSWNTSGLDYGNYTLKAVAETVPGETNTANNNFTCIKPVHVGVPGDVSSSAPGVYDQVCNMKDVAYLIILFNTNPSSPSWNPNADVNSDGVANMKDIAIAILNFNKHE